MEKGHIIYFFKLTIYSTPITIITVFTEHKMMSLLNLQFSGTCLYRTY